MKSLPPVGAIVFYGMVTLVVMAAIVAVWQTGVQHGREYLKPKADVIAPLCKVVARGGLDSSTGRSFMLYECPEHVEVVIGDTDYDHVAVTRSPAPLLTADAGMPARDQLIRELKMCEHALAGYEP